MCSRSVAELDERYTSGWENGKATTSGMQDEHEWPRLHGAIVRLEELDIAFESCDTQRRGSSL